MTKPFSFDTLVNYDLSGIDMADDFLKRRFCAFINRYVPHMKVPGELLGDGLDKKLKKDLDKLGRLMRGVSHLRGEKTVSFVTVNSTLRNHSDFPTALGVHLRQKIRPAILIEFLHFLKQHGTSGSLTKKFIGTIGAVIRPPYPLDEILYLPCFERAKRELTIYDTFMGIEGSCHFIGVQNE